MQPTFRILLYQPEIPPNTGNIIRLCANTGADLHLIEPLGFALDDRQLRRAGLDYHEYAKIQAHSSFSVALATLKPRRVFAFTTRAMRRYDEPQFQSNDVFLFGPETRGLPISILDQIPAKQHLRLPVRPGNRSLNLANCVAITIYEAWRQHAFAGGH